MPPSDAMGEVTPLVGYLRHLQEAADSRNLTAAVSFAAICACWLETVRPTPRALAQQLELSLRFRCAEFRFQKQKAIQ